MDHVSYGSTFSQKIESIEGLRSLDVDQEVFNLSIFSRNFLNVEDFCASYMELRPRFHFTEQYHLF